jgi:hypothetical protein
LLFPLLVGHAGDVTLYFYVAALLNMVALVCWNYIEPARTLFCDDVSRESEAMIRQNDLPCADAPL